MNIPNSVQENNHLSINAKYLYGIMVDNIENGFCLKDNAFFASKLGCSERSIYRFLKELEKEGLISFVPYGRLKNAIYINSLAQEVVEKEEKEEEKLEIIHFDAFSDKICDKFGKNFDNHVTNSKFDNNQTYILDDNNNLVLVSKENKNININNSARACACESIFSNKSNRFTNFDTLSSNERVRCFSQNERRQYTDVLFKDFFKYYPSGKIFDVGIEIVDTMIEMLNQSSTERGLVFQLKHYTAKRLSDIYLNITNKEFINIVFNVCFKENIENRSAYIAGAILNAGRRISYSKTSELIRKGFPWDNWEAENTELNNLICSIKKLTQNEKIKEKLSEQNTEKLMKRIAQISQKEDL